MRGISYEEKLTCVDEIRTESVLTKELEEVGVQHQLVCPAALVVHRVRAGWEWQEQGVHWRGGRAEPAMLHPSGLDSWAAPLFLGHQERAEITCRHIIFSTLHRATPQTTTPIHQIKMCPLDCFFTLINKNKIKILESDHTWGYPTRKLANRF